MSQKINAALVLACFLSVFSFHQIASAQTVDPCQYGCPKSGCPKCPEGGPIKSQSAPFVKAQATPGNECVTGCKNDNRDRVKECSVYYPPESQPAKHRECLDKAKTKFDACMAAC